MGIHYLYNLSLLFFFALSRKYFKLIVLITYPLFLIYLPDTGYDFSHYERAYETIFYSPDAKLFFRSRSILTAEPGWFLYNGIISFLTQDFRGFLVVNFILCVYVLLKTLDLLEIKKDDQSLMLLLMVPVIFPTLFFWSPRSSISFVLALFSLANAIRGRFIVSLISAIASGLIHSQYLPALGLVNLCLAFSKLEIFERNRIIVIFLVFLGMLVMLLNVGFFLSLLSFMPSAETIQQKSAYLSSRQESFRATSILSIVVFPILIFIFREKIKREGLFTFIIVLSAFSFVVNVAFFKNAHVAGRLSRVSDYFLFSYLIAISFYYVKKIKYFMLFSVLVVYPFAFPDLYPFDIIYELI